MGAGGIGQRTLTLIVSPHKWVRFLLAIVKGDAPLTKRRPSSSSTARGRTIKEGDVMGIFQRPIVSGLFQTLFFTFSALASGACFLPMDMDESSESESTGEQSTNIGHEDGQVGEDAAGPQEASEEEEAACAVSLAGPALDSHITEADTDYLSRLSAMDQATLPMAYDLSLVSTLERSLIGYMLEIENVTSLQTDDLLQRGQMGRAVLLALGVNEAPIEVDYGELRRGLYHFYNCDRDHPETLDEFIDTYGDFYSWPTYTLDQSFPKISQRRMMENVEEGIYVAQTMRHGLAYETEILLDGYRRDGALEFLAYVADGQLSSTGEFRAGADLAVGASPHTCMSCHRDADTERYEVIFPLMTLEDPERPGAGDDQTVDTEESTGEQTSDPAHEDGTDSCALMFQAEARDESGPCTVCTQGDYITLVGIVENPCDTALNHHSQMSCLVSEFYLYNQNSGSASSYPMTCLNQGATDLIQPGATISQTRPAGRLSEASYTLEVQFEDADQTVRLVDFMVQ